MYSSHLVSTSSYLWTPIRWVGCFHDNTSHDNGTCTYCCAWRHQLPVLSCTCCFSLSYGCIAFYSFPTCHRVKCEPAHTL